MTFELPSLPYADTALEPYYSAKTFSFHHGKHHKAYVDNLNKLLPGSPFENSTLEEIILAVAGDSTKAGFFNNAAQVWNHTFFWHCMKPGGGGAPGGVLADKINAAFGSYEKFAEQFKAAAVGRFGSGWAWLALGRRRAQDHEHAQRRDPHDRRQKGAPDGGCLGACLLPGLPEPPARLRADVPGSSGELGLRRREPGLGLQFRHRSDGVSSDAHPFL